MEKKKFMSRAALILSNAVAINRVLHQASDEKSLGKENDLSESKFRSGINPSPKRRLFGDIRKHKYLTSTPIVAKKVNGLSFLTFCTFTFKKIICYFCYHLHFPQQFQIAVL